MKYTASILTVDCTTCCEKAGSYETLVHVCATLHGVMHHKIVIFILTPVRRSNPKQTACYVYLIPPPIQVMYRSTRLSRSWTGRHKSVTMLKTGTFYTKSNTLTGEQILSTFHEKNILAMPHLSSRMKVLKTDVQLELFIDM